MCALRVETLPAIGRAPVGQTAPSIAPDATARRLRVAGLLAVLALRISIASAADEPGWSYGVARANITPKEALWIGGFAARTRPAEGTLDDLWVQALALRAPNSGAVVLVSADLVGVPKWLYEAVVARLTRQHGLDRSRILLASSHTHSGPVLRDALQDIYPLDDVQLARIGAYSDWLLEAIVATVGQALAQRHPARLWAGEGEVGFGVNRRNNVESEFPALLARGAAPKGLADHAVPVLALRAATGELVAVVFGYAAHASALTDNYLWSADYPGYALLLKTRHGPTTWVAGYANDVMAYIPSQTVWEEGGYQAGAFEVYGLPAKRWAPGLEARITAAVGRLIDQVRAGPAPAKRAR